MTTSGIFEPYQRLEQEYARFVGSDYAVSCNSGTAALHLALLALGVGYGDEVIVPDFAMVAAAFSVSYTGATPVFGDVSLDTYGLQVEEVRRLISPKTKAIIVVHTYGRVNNIQQYKQFNLPIIEDAAEAQGAVYQSKADLTCYSFYRNKIISAEEGGIVTTNNSRYAETMRQLKNMAFTPEHDYFHPTIGYNYRMPNAQAKLALDSLECYSENSERRRMVEGWYNDFFTVYPPSRDAVWFYETVGQIVLQGRGMRHAFKPLSSLPPYRDGTGLPNSSRLSQSLVLYPVHPSMRQKKVVELCDDVAQIERKHRA